MQQLSIKKDKQNNPVMTVSISGDEITNLKLAVVNHPKFVAEDTEGDRLRNLAGKEDWDRLTQMNVSDLKEAVNKYIQDHAEDDITAMTALNDNLNGFRKAMVNS